MGKNKPVLMFDERRDLISMIYSIKETSKILGVTPRSVSNCCKGVSIMCKGHYLRYMHPAKETFGHDCFETIELIQYDEMCGETRFYFHYDDPGSRSKPEKKQKMTADQIRSLERNRRNKVLAQQYKFYPDNLCLIAHHGWFIDIYSNHYLRKMLKTKLDGENIEVVNKAIAKHYKTYAKEIIEALCDEYPKWRNFISEQVMSSYDRGHYELATIGIFRAIDGICSAKFNKSFFTKKPSDNNEYIPVVVDYLLKVQNDFFKIFITPISHDCPIFVKESMIDKFPSKLNRHTAVHGRDLTYGTEENFLRSLSLLKYVSDMLYFSDICAKNGKSIERYMYSKSDLNFI